MGTPEWIEWAQALGIPILAVAVSYASYRSGRWNVRIDRERLRHDLYDRRYAIYLAFHRLLVAIVEREDFETELRYANAARAQSPFLLDRKLRAYLDRIYTEAYRIHEERRLVLQQNLWSNERTARATQLGADRKALAGRLRELIEEFSCLRLTDLS